MPRRSDGLYRRPDADHWWATYTDASGRRTRRSTGTANYAEARTLIERWRQEARATRLHGAEPERAFEALMLDYLTGPSQRKRSAETDRHRAKPLRDFFSGRDLRTLRPRDITDYITWRMGQGVKASTANRDLALLSSAINWARHQLEWQIPNPVAGRLLSEPEGRLRWITQEEAERLIDEAARARRVPFLADFCIVALHTGCRKEELLGLEWSRVDLRAGLIHLEGERTKNERRRSVPLSKRARAALLRRSAYRASVAPSAPHVFIAANGERMRSVRGAFAGACRRAGITDFRIHDMRHTCASWLVMAGVPLAQIRDLLGHSTILMTERYAHLAPESLRAAVDRLDALGHVCVTVEDSSQAERA